MPKQVHTCRQFSTRENGQTRIHKFRVIIIIFFFFFKPAISLPEQVQVIIFPPNVSTRVARGVHGHQAMVFLQLHISAVDREVHHSKHKTTPFLPNVRGRPAREACTYVRSAHTLHLRKFHARAGALSCARARKRTYAWTGIYTCSVYVCAQLHNLFFTGLCPKWKKNEWNKCKNHFNEMKGGCRDVTS